MARIATITTGPTSTGTPLFGLPDFGTVGEGFDELQPRAGQRNDLQDAAIGEQRGLRDTLGGLFSGLGEGARGRIDQQALTASRNVAGGLRNRGFAGSSLNLPGQLGVEGARQGRLGELSDQLFGARQESETGISGRLSDLLFGSSTQSTQFLQDLLGSGGIGTQTVNTPSVKTSAIGRGLGSGTNLAAQFSGSFGNRGPQTGSTFGGDTGGIQGGGINNTFGGGSDPGFFRPRTQF